MVIAREVCEQLFRDAVADCDPAERVRRELPRFGLAGKVVIGLAFGKASLAMARGAGPVARGLVVTHADDGRGMPAGWHVVVAGHPEPDERSLAAGDAAIDLVASARASDVVLALISGGASALVERPAGITLDRLRTEIGAIAASGASIGEINRARKARSAIKGGKLAAMSDAPVITLVVSDVVGDDVTVIGSGPTVAGRDLDTTELIAPMSLFGATVRKLVNRLGVHISLVHALLVEDVATVADQLFAKRDAQTLPLIASGEPTIRIPADHGEGGRAQQLALELAHRMRGRELCAFVVGSDGADGPPPRDRPTPAGAYVDGATWDRIVAAGIDPDAALVHCDAGTALAAVGALVVTGPTGINHGDLVLIG